MMKTPLERVNAVVNVVFVHYVNNILYTRKQDFTYQLESKMNYRKGILNTDRYIKKLDFVFHQFPWYHSVFIWYIENRVSEREVFDAVNYLIRYNKKYRH